MTKRTTLLLFDVADAHLRVLGRHDTEREFFRNHGDGFSSLRAPFFGRALFAAFPGRYSVIPLDSAVMHLRYSGEDRTGTIQLPIAPRPFPRSAVEAYADSVTAAWGRDPQLRRAAEDAREVYSSLETPALAPFARRLLRMGTEAWVEVFPLPPVRTVEWLVIDVESRVVKAHLSVPTSVTVLGGDVQSVIALVRSALDEEFVEVYDVRR